MGGVGGGKLSQMLSLSTRSTPAPDASAKTANDSKQGAVHYKMRVPDRLPARDPQPKSLNMSAARAKKCTVNAWKTHVKPHVVLTKNRTVHPGVHGVESKNRTFASRLTLS